MNRSFQDKYRQIEKEMKKLAEGDGDVFLPNPEPAGRVDYVLICMEPSLNWARTVDEARAKVAAGFRNFLAGIDPMILHFCVRRFLCERGQRYHITDFSKGAMWVKLAAGEREERYKKWYPLLKEEIDLIAQPDARVIAVGKTVANFLSCLGFPRRFTPIMHYSQLAAKTRSARLKGHEHSFRAFKDSISLEDVLATAKDVLEESRVPKEISERALALLMGRQLTTSRRQLIFSHKLDFEAMRATADCAAPEPSDNTMTN
jgi:hypothetical protein